MGNRHSDIWHLYIVECRDGSLYTGIALDVDRRVREHNEGTASKYTRTRRPVTLLYTESYPDYKSAWTRERQIKRFPRAKKLTLIANTRKSKIEDRKSNGRSKLQNWGAVPDHLKNDRQKGGIR